MAEGPDDSQKTEDPTAKRLQDAAEKGDVAKSQEIPAVFTLAAATLIVWLLLDGPAGGLAQGMMAFLERPHLISLGAGGAFDLFRETSFMMLLLLAVPCALLMAAGIAGHVFQARPNLSAEKIQPKLSKISPLQGLKRIFGPEGLLNLGKGLAKITVVALAVLIVVWPEREIFPALVSVDVAALIEIARSMVVRVMAAVLAVLIVIAAIDYAYQRHAFLKRNRMTRQEVRDEYKQLEGDPQVKQKLKQIRAKRARERMIAAVPDATVVIMNPTHYAVALKYESGKMEAPVCVAKGVDAVALRIREVAEAHDVPVVENPPLARALFASVEVEQSIPAEHFRAVAEVIGYVMRLNRRR